MQDDTSDSPDAATTRTTNITAATTTGDAPDAPRDTSTLMPPPPPRPKPLAAPSLNPLLVGATVVAAPGRNTNGTSSTTSTSTSTTATAAATIASRAPLAKRGRRGKVPLEKGYSQVEWLRRARERVVPPPRDVTPDELASHSTPTDCWAALRGKVYDLTPYLRFHPGGVRLLVAVAGKDATAVFDSYHQWVNAGALLASCLVGRLVDGEGDGDGEGEGTRKKAAVVVATVAEVEAAADAAEAKAEAAALAAAAAAAEARAGAASVASLTDDAVR